MARPRADAHAIPTRVRILTAAEEVFGEHGYVDARLEDIAGIAGIRRPSLLYHFRSKDLLYTEVVHQLFAALRQVFDDAVRPAGTFEDRLLTLMQAYLDFIAARPAFAPLVLREIIRGDKASPVHQILLGELVPLLDWVEVWINNTGGTSITPGLPVRSAILHLGSNALVHAASGPLQEPLWGPSSGLLTMTRCLFLGRATEK